MQKIIVLMVLTPIFKAHAMNPPTPTITSPQVGPRIHQQRLYQIPITKRVQNTLPTGHSTVSMGVPSLLSNLQKSEEIIEKKISDVFTPIIINAIRRQDNRTFNGFFHHRDGTERTEITQSPIKIKHQDPHGYTALMWAAFNRNSRQLSLLIGTGKILERSTSFINDKNHQGESTLFIAAYAGDTACVDLLLENNADITSTNTSGTTPLMQACFNNQTDCAQLLIQAKADPTAADHDGWTAWDYAHYAQAEDCLRLLCKSMQKK